MRHRLLFPIVSLAFAGLTIFLGYFAQRADFQSFITGYTAFFGLYVWVVFFLKNGFSPNQIRHLLWLGIGLRALLLFSIPNLSDDYARFLWDGRLTVAGIHPFAHPPNHFMENQILPPGVTPALFDKLNSPEYFTVYPPVCQAVFALAAWAFPSSELGSVFVMKLFLLVCEMGTICILRQTRVCHAVGIRSLEKNCHAGYAHLARSDSDSMTNHNVTEATVLAYALNPLAILEIVGNCHFEGAMIFFLLAGMAALQHGKVVKGAIWWALATASKMLPIMFLPIVWRWLGWRRGWVFVSIFALASVVLFAPLLAVLPNILESLDLYFRQFQFNASVYYLVREIGFQKIGWDIGEFSGPALGGLTVLGVLAIAIFTASSRKFDPERIGIGKLALETALLFALLLYLSLAATVQPWYATVPLAISLLTRWRFGVVWSGVVVFSYSHYEGGGLQENYWLIGLEYGVLWAFVLWEVCHSFVQKPPDVSS